MQVLHRYSAKKDKYELQSKKIGLNKGKRKALKAVTKNQLLKLKALQND